MKTNNFEIAKWRGGVGEAGWCLFSMYYDLGPLSLSELCPLTSEGNSNWELVRNAGFWPYRRSADSESASQVIWAHSRVWRIALGTLETVTFNSRSKPVKYRCLPPVPVGVSGETEPVGDNTKRFILINWLTWLWGGWTSLYPLDRQWGREGHGQSGMPGLRLKLSSTGSQEGKILRRKSCCRRNRY